MKLNYYASLLFLLCLSSCATINNQEISQLISSNKCYQKTDYNYSKEEMPSASSLALIKNSSLNQKISASSLNIANAIGLIPKLEELNQLQAHQNNRLTLEERIRLLEIKQSIYNKINNASLAISAVSSELDCEDERISQIANYLSDKQHKLESNLTISAIVIGATGGILSSGVIQNNKTSNAVAIGTGISEAALGLTMLFNKRKIVIKHQRNILKDIWDGPETSKKFPAFIWYYLNQDNIEGTSLRKEMIEKWSQFGQIDKKDQAFSKLYFDEGGKYTSDELSNRADMYDQLESQIYLLKQKLMTLASEVEKI